MKPKSVKNAYTLVVSAIALYAERSFKVTLPTRQPLQYNVPTDEDVQLLMAEARPDLRLAIMLAAVGTLRRGEICGLKYKDVIPNVGVYVHTDMVLSKDNTWIHKEIPKTSDSVRLVSLPSEALSMIEDGEPDAYIIDGTPAAISDAFGRLRDRLGLSCRFHDLRHYAVSILHAIGVPDQYLMERGGWATPGTLQAVYRNTLSDKSKEFSDKANAYFSKNLLNGRKE
jgi:integrase